MITAPRSRPGRLARDGYESGFGRPSRREALDRSAECVQLREQAQAPTAPPGAQLHASRARGAAAKASHGWASSTALVRRVQAPDRDPAARALVWLLDAGPAAAQDSEEEAGPASDTRTKAGARTGAGRSARAALRVPPPATGTAAHSRTGGPLLRGQRRGAAREHARGRVSVRRPRRLDHSKAVLGPYQ